MTRKAIKNRISSWVPKDLIDWIDQKAKDDERTRSNMICVLLNRARKLEKES